MTRVCLALTAAAAATSYSASVAQACGGFFCSAATPMDQAGEKIVFAVEPDGTTVAHVQIQYQGAASSFAWILPVPSVPEIAVGTDLLFETMESATRPLFWTDRRTEGVCRTRPTCPAPARPDGGLWSGGPDAAAPDASSGWDAGPSTVEVHFREAVGPYDAAVISSPDANDLLTWLSDNGYDIPDASRPLIEDYIAKNDVFVALKLLTDRAAGEIQPVVLRYRELQPCIPIRLTAIATVPDMPITAWVLADRRTVPYNYMSLLPPVDDARLWRGTVAYESLVTAAVDDAGGRAFVTDYAGGVPAARVPMLPPVDDLRTETDVRLFLRTLQARRITGDTQLLGILTRHIPPPFGVRTQDFYNCLINEWCTSYDAYVSTLAFEPGPLVDDLTAQVITPRTEANAMLARHTKLTRLFTTMSAHEMTEDPVFVLSAMPDVSNVHTAVEVTECSSEYFRDQAPQKLVLPNGDEVRLSWGTPYTGTDEEYCTTGPGAGPGASGTPSTATAGAAGGGGCAVTTTSTAPFGAALAALVALALLRRRRVT